MSGATTGLPQPYSSDLLDLVSDGLVALDHQLHVVYTNYAFERLSGVGRDEIQGRPICQALPSLGGAALQEQLRRCTTEGVALQVEHFEPGTARWLSIRISPAAEGMLLQFCDITDARRGRLDAEQQLTALETIYTHAPVGLCVLSPDLRYLRINDRLAEINGLPAADHLGRSVREIVPSLADQCENIRQRILETQSPVHIDLVGETPAKPGVVRVWSEVWYPHWNSDGTLDSIHIVAEEVTERKEAERLLRESRERLSAFFNSSAVGAAVLTPEARFVDVNDAFCRMTGYSRESLLHMDCQALIHPDDREAAANNLKALRDNAAADFTVEERCLRADGAIIWVRNSVSATRDGQGTPRHLILISEDVTPRKRAELRDRMLASLDDATRPLTDAGEIALSAMRLLGAHLAVDRAVYLTVDADTGVAVALGEYSPELPPTLGRYQLAEYGHKLHETLLAGEPYAEVDAGRNDLPESERALFAALGIKAFYSVPLRKDGRLAALITVQRIDAHTWTAEEADLVYTVANRCWEAVERSRVTQELRESEERFRLLAQAMPVMIWTARPDGYSDYSNERWLQYTGQALEETYGLGWLNVVHPDDHAEIENRWWKAVRAREPFEIEYRIRRASDGQWRWHLVRSIPLKNDRGEIVKWMGTSTDIHARFEAERQIKELGETLRFHVENTPLAVVEFAAPDYVVTRWSERAEALFGWTAGEIVGRALSDLSLVYEEDVARVAALSADMAAGRRLQNVHRNRNITKDGRVLHCEWYNSARLAADGSLSSVFSLVLDVTERVRAEEALRRGEARFRRLIEQSIFGVALGDFEGGISYANDAFLRIIGYSRDEFEAQGLRWTELTPPEWLPLDRKAAEELRTVGHATPFEKEYFRKDGSRVPILIGGTLVDDPLDGGERIVGFYMDLTEIKKAQAEIERSNQELQSFVYTASHDLQEPLRTVVAFTQMVARRWSGKLGEETDRHIAFILEAAERMAKLMASLLEYSRASEPAPASREAVPLERVLAHVEQVMSFAVAESQAVITHDPLPTVNADDGQMVQLLQNLIGNSIKYRKPGEPPRIHVSARRSGPAEWTITVRDNGIGFDPSHAADVFGAFRRLHGRAYSGTGIGLAICRKIVESHGGRIWAESKEGDGSIFAFTLGG